MQSSPEHTFPFLSPHEEESMHNARVGGPPAEDEHEMGPPTHTDEDTHRASGSEEIYNSSRNADILYSLNQSLPEPTDVGGGLPMYQATVHRSNFDFTPMEEYRAEERQRLRISSPNRSKNLFAQTPDYKTPFYSPTGQLEEPTHTSEPVLETEDADADPAASTSDFNRLRQRRLSQSNAPGRRRGKTGKVALFEGNANGILGAPPPSFVHPNNGRLAVGPSAWDLGPSAGQGHDRPYRFSFYSNALSATIHAKSLSELPGDGQTFEELFTGKRLRTPAGTADAARSAHAQPKSVATPPQRNSRNNSPARPIADGGLGPEKGARPNAPIEDDWEGNTWWLDVLNPTDEEMRMLSKVGSIFLAL